MSSSARATFAGRWARAVSARAQDPFLIWEDRGAAVTRWTYAEFDALVDRVASGLVARRVGHGDRVHVVLANSPAFVALWLAIAKVGAVMVPCDPQSSAPEIARQITRTRAKVGVCAHERAATYLEGAANQDIVVVEVDEDETALDALSGTEPLPEVAIGPRDPLGILFTSGTTSAPKGVVITQANYAFAGDVMAAAAALAADDRQYVVLPMFHANAQYYSFASAISVGASVVLMPKFSATGYIEGAARHEVTHGSLFAAPMRMILAKDTPAVEGFAFAHMWYAQNVTAEQYADLSTRFGCAPRQLYGMTETIPAVLTNPALDPRVGPMGLVSLGTQVELREPDHSTAVSDGEVGEIVVGGEPGITLFAHYYEDPEVTAASFRDGWFRTGDLAVRDEDGFFHFAGRRGDVLKVSGENVSTVEVEAVLAEHESVLEAAVVGEPDPVRDEVPVAFVVAAPGHTIDVEVLLEHCAQRLVPSKRPRRIDVVEELPRTSVGKIRKFMLTPTSQSHA